MDFDSALKQVGEFGRYQKRLYFLVSILSLPLASHMLIFVFVSGVPEWNCPSSKGQAIFHCNSSRRECCDSHGSMCYGAVFAPNFTSIVTEWKLACGKRYKSELTQSIFVAGFMFGVLIFGILSDKFGRRKPWLISCVVGSVLAGLSGIVSSYEQYVVLRFLTGAMVGGGGLVTFIFSTESIGKSYRGLAGTWQNAFYSVGYVILALQAYLIRDWRILTIVTVLPSFMIIFLARNIPESPRWLASQGRTEEAESILRKMEKENGSHNTSSVVFLKTDTKKGNITSKYGITDLFTHRSLSVVTTVMLIVWCVNSMVYYGLALNVKNLGGSLYINFILASLVELPSCAVTQFLLATIGRRKSLVFLLLASSFSCFICMLLQLQRAKHLIAISATALAGKFWISASFAVIYVYSAELFPTVVRNIGMGLSSFSARVGGIVAPFVVLLGDDYISLPMFLFTCATVFAAVVSLKLPETQGKAMPETFEDLGRSRLETLKVELEPPVF